MLEQITGTEIYSQISIRVHERRREAREKLNLLQAETAGIVMLDPKQEQETRQTLEINNKEETDLTAKFAETQKAMDWLTTIDGLKKEIIHLSDEANKLQGDIEAFKPEREKLNQALSAVSLDGAYATLSAIRKQQTDDRAGLKTEQEALPRLESFAKEQTKALKLAEQQTIQAKEALKSATPILQKIRALDEKLSAKKKTLEQENESYKKAIITIEADKKAQIEELEKRAKAYASLAFVEDYLKEHAQDEWLISALAGVEEQIDGLLFKQDEILQKEAAQEAVHTTLQRAIKSYETHHKQLSICKKELGDSLKRLEQNKEALSQLLGERLLREYRTEKETLLREMAFLTKIAKLQAHRAKLEDGKPCPLCGATEHPFAQGNLPIPDETERRIEALTSLISKAEHQEAIIKKLAEAEKLARKNLTEAEKLELVAANEQTSAKKALTETQDTLVKLRADFAKRRQAVLTKLQNLGITDIPKTDFSSLIEHLKARLKAWQEQVKKKAEIEKQILAFDSEIKRLDALIETQSNALTEKLERLDILEKEFTAGNDERKAIYGDKNPENEERHLIKTISQAEDFEKQLRERHHESQQKCNIAKSSIDTLNKRIEQRAPELKKLETEFITALALAGFSSEEQFLAAILSPKQRAELMSKVKNIDERQTDLKARQKDRETRLAKEISHKLTDQSLEELQAQLKAQEVSLKELRDIIAGLKHKLSEHASAKARIKEKQVAIEIQEKERQRWENLHELIGSADGKKYRNFAQGLTFEMMVAYANQQLQKMTDRYLLTRDTAQPLELNVIDNYQAGEIRSSKNLSGGESFIVSLSLALGLSHMASQNVRVDSLFLDEGFGTLDEEALDSALQTLTGLQQEGKLIGIISHVSALKERISTQIHVTPKTGGRSQLSGAGCRQIA
nr:SbcC/MukB-like Walker B domain-containing protein [Rappaport israeli]